MIGFRRVKPLLNRVLVKKAEPIAKSKGGILLPENKSEQLNFGVVIEVGPGTHDDNGNFRKWFVKVGDTVLLPDYSGVKITLADEAEVYIYRDNDIIGVLSEKVQ